MPSTVTPTIQGRNQAECDRGFDSRVFVGRQPIFDRQQRVFGYELLFRAGTDNRFTGIDGDAATAKVISNSAAVVGLSTLTGGKPAFINITRRFLLEGLYEVLPPSQIVVELLENVEPDREVVEACRRVKQSGYLLALDDFVYQPGYERLLDLADIVKIDFCITNAQSRRTLIQQVTRRNLCLLAEKVETHADHQEAQRLGYCFFQGYFFEKPQVIVGRDIPAYKRTYLSFLQEVNRPDLNFDHLEGTVKQDVAVTTKLLRYLNSASFGLSNRISSVKQALVLLGQGPLRKWASLAALACMADDKPDELVVALLVRARACEQIGRSLGLRDRELDLFMMGLLSGMDALIDRRLDELLIEMPVAFDVKAALMGSSTMLGCILRLVLACERGLVVERDKLLEQLALPAEEVGQVYASAVAWADRVFNQ